MSSEQEKNVINTVSVRGGYVDRAGRNISWASIFAGLVSFFALEILFVFLLSGLGLSKLDLRSLSSAANSGNILLIVSVVALLVSFFIAGLVSGTCSTRNSVVHGFLTWALSTIVAMAVLMGSAASLLTGLGDVLGSLGGGLASGASTLVSGSGQVLSKVIKEGSDQMYLDFQDLDKKTLKLLRDTKEPRLQPEYLQDQLDVFIQDAKKAAKNVVVEGADFHHELEVLTKSAEDRIAEIGKDFDRSAIKKSLTKNSDLSAAEADKAVDRVIESYEKYSEQAKSKLETAKKELSEINGQIESGIENGISSANEGINHAANFSLWGFVGLLGSAIMSILGAIIGAKIVNKQEARG